MARYSFLSSRQVLMIALVVMGSLLPNLVQAGPMKHHDNPSGNDDKRDEGDHSKKDWHKEMNGHFLNHHDEHDRDFASFCAEFFHHGKEFDKDGHKGHENESYLHPALCDLMHDKDRDHEKHDDKCDENERHSKWLKCFLRVGRPKECKEDRKHHRDDDDPDCKQGKIDHPFEKYCGVGGDPVPEPATLGLVGIGLVGLIAARRFRRTQIV